MEQTDLLNPKDWLTVKEAVGHLSDKGITVNVAQLYQRAASNSRRKRVSIKSLEVFGTVILLKSDVESYGLALKNKRSAKQRKRSAAATQ